MTFSGLKRVQLADEGRKLLASELVSSLHHTDELSCFMLQILPRIDRFFFGIMNGAAAVPAVACARGSCRCSTTSCAAAGFLQAIKSLR